MNQKIDTDNLLSRLQYQYSELCVTDVVPILAKQFLNLPRKAVATFSAPIALVA